MRRKDWATSPSDFFNGIDCCKTNNYCKDNRFFITSNNIIPVATDTFKDSMLPAKGMRTFLSQRDKNFSYLE